MNGIKGLIIKDLLQLKTYKRTLIIYIAIFCLSSLSLDSGIGNMLIVMLILGLGMFSITSFSYDEFNKADRYILTLPVTKKEVVLSKYLLIILSTLVGCVIGIVLTIIMSIIIDKPIPNFKDMLSTGLGGLLAVGFIECIQVPCIYKFGAEKGRMQMIILTALLGSAIYLISKINISIPNTVLIKLLKSILPLILILLGVLMYYISYKIYSKKEL